MGKVKENSANRLGSAITALLKLLENWRILASVPSFLNFFSLNLLGSLVMSLLQAWLDNPDLSFIGDLTDLTVQSRANAHF